MKKGTYKHSPERLKKMRKAQKGHIVLESTREKLRIIHKGKRYSPKTEFKKGTIYPERRNRIEIECKTCKKTFETKKSHSHKRLNCSGECSSIYRSLKVGEKSSNWKGGLSFLPYSSDFTMALKKSIRRRDNYICQECKKSEGKELDEYGIRLAIHHIDFNKNNCNTDNLITLCRSCNSKANKNREFHTIYYKSKLLI